MRATRHPGRTLNQHTDWADGARGTETALPRSGRFPAAIDQASKEEVDLVCQVSWDRAHANNTVESRSNADGSLVLSEIASSMPSAEEIKGPNRPPMLVIVPQIG